MEQDYTLEQILHELKGINSNINSAVRLLTQIEENTDPLNPINLDDKSN